MSEWLSHIAHLKFIIKLKYLDFLDLKFTLVIIRAFAMRLSLFAQILMHLLHQFAILLNDFFKVIWSANYFMQLGKFVMIEL